MITRKITKPEDGTTVFSNFRVGRAFTCGRCDCLYRKLNNDDYDNTFDYKNDNVKTIAGIEEVFPVDYEPIALDWWETRVDSDPELETDPEAGAE